MAKTLSGTWIVPSFSVVQPVARLLAEHMAAHSPGNPPMSAVRFVVDGARLENGLKALCETLPSREAVKVRVAAEDYLSMRGCNAKTQALALKRAAKLRELILTASSSAETRPPTGE